MAREHGRVLLTTLLVMVGFGSPTLAAEDAPATASNAAVAPPQADPEGLDAVRALLRAGKTAEAEAQGLELLARVEATDGPDSLAAAAVLDVLVAALGRGGKVNAPEMRRFAERIVAIVEKELGPAHADVASGLAQLAEVLHHQADYAAARRLYERVLAINEKALGPDHPDVAWNLQRMAFLARTMGDATGARPLFERALAINVKELGPDHPRVAETLDGLAMTLRDLGDAAGARPLFERALAINEKALGPDDRDVAMSLNNLALVLKDLGDYAEAERLYERALAILETATGPRSAYVASALHNLAMLRRAMGDHAAARPPLERALAIVLEAAGPEHPQVAVFLASLAGVLESMGDHAGARPLFERALAINEKALGAEHPSVARSLNNLALLFQDLGDHAGARPLLERSLAIREKALGTEHPDVATGLNSLAGVLMDVGDAVAPRPLLERALAVREKALGPDHPLVATDLNNLASFLTKTSDLAGALPLTERALAIREKALGPDHPDVSSTLSNLGFLLYLMGDHGRARPLLERSLAIALKALGPEHPDDAVVLSRLASVLAATGEGEGAIARALEAEVISREHLRLTSATLSGREALRYAASRQNGLDVALSCALAGRGTPPAGDVLDQLIRSRGLTLDVLAERRRAGTLSPEAADLARARTVAATRLATLAARGPGDRTPEAHAAILDAARKEMEAAERELGRKSATFREGLQRAQVGLAEVRAALSPGEALVACSRFESWPVLHAGETTPRPETPEPTYVAFVLKAGEAQPAIVPLGAARQLELAVSRWRNAATNPGAAPEAVRAAGERLRALAWDPVAARLGDTRRVIVVPDGALLSVPFAALPAEDGRYLVESPFTIACMSTERDLARGAAPPPAPAGLLALGGADFAAASPLARGAPIASAADATPVAQLASAATYSTTASSCPTFESLSFAPLPATAGEAEDVARAWRRGATHARLGQAATTLLGAAATEAAFKREAGRHRMLHVATHGFFLGPGCAPTVESRGLEGGPGTQALSGLALESPLLRSGLALARFNGRREAKDGEEDGVLTAEEVASLDLSGVEWAVLSACETGLGDVQSGEGVLGLQRAFAIAGADTVIMSLWKVPDAETRQFMRALYDARLMRGLDAAECVREASLAVLRDRRERGLDDSPFWWGAFVASGEWR